jgi:hypothetical protein
MDKQQLKKYSICFLIVVVGSAVGSRIDRMIWQWRSQVGQAGNFIASPVATLNQASPSESGQGPLTAYETIIQNVCEEDLKKYCPSVKAGDGNGQTACLLEKMDSVSEKCRSSHLKPTIDSWKVCEKDLGKFCPEVKFGGGRVLGCLKKNQKHLSPECLMRVKE